jgi:hypothetical protein
MLSFRFHIVSLVAVFLALAIGILMGTTVVSRETLAQLRTQIARADDEIDELQAQRDELEAQLDEEHDRTERYIAESFPLLVADRLVDQPVMVLAADGIDGDPLDRLQESLAAAGAVFEGTIWLNERMTMEDEDDVAEVARLLGRSSTDAGATRQALLLRLADELVEPVGTTVPDEPADAGEEAAPPLLLELLTAGFIDYEPPSGGEDDRIVPEPGTRFVVVAGTGSDLPSDGVLYPLLRAIAVSGETAPAVAAEGGDPDTEDGEEPSEPAPFVGPLRADNTLAERVSTVDNLDTPAGLAAIVFALQQLQLGAVGHFGVAESAQRLLPPLATAS